MVSTATRPMLRVTVPVAPNAISGLAGWWDASDATTMFTDTAGTVPVAADNDIVARINDKSGNARNLTQATLGLRPLYRTAAGGQGLNGLSVLSFDGADDYLSLTTPVFTAGSGLTVFVVVRVDTLQVSKYACGQDTASGSTVFSIQVSTASSVLTNIFLASASAAGTQVSDTAPTPLAAATFLAAGVVDSNASAAGFTNGVPRTAGPTAFAQALNGNGVTFVLGARRTNAGRLLGRIGEAVIYDHALTGYERQQVESGLRAKWAI